jgi:predicted dehydrogenase
MRRVRGDACQGVIAGTVTPDALTAFETVHGIREGGPDTIVVVHHGDLDGAPHFTTLADLLASNVQVDAVSLCTPPQPRHALARLALPISVSGFALALCSGLVMFLSQIDEMGHNRT